MIHTFTGCLLPGITEVIIIFSSHQKMVFYSLQHMLLHKDKELLTMSANPVP